MGYLPGHKDNIRSCQLHPNPILISGVYTVSNVRIKTQYVLLLFLLGKMIHHGKINVPCRLQILLLDFTHCPVNPLCRGASKKHRETHVF